MTNRLDHLEDNDLSGQPQSLIGSYFHGNAARGWQGAVVAEPRPGIYLVELFSWLGGNSSCQHLIPIETMVEEQWRFYDTAEWMNNEYNHGGVGRRWEMERAEQRDENPCPQCDHAGLQHDSQGCAACDCIVAVLR